MGKSICDFMLIKPSWCSKTISLSLKFYSEESVKLRSDGFLALALYSTVVVVYSGSLDASSFERVGPERALAQARFATSLFKPSGHNSVPRALG